MVIPVVLESENAESFPYRECYRGRKCSLLKTLKGEGVMRPDVAFTLSVTSRYQSNPGESHWTAVKNILKYFRWTKDAFLVYGGKEELFQTDRDDFKSQAGYVFCLNGGAVTWKSYKQDTTADSTTEAEYMAAAEAAKEGVWLKNFITELGVVSSIKNPIPLFCDNNGAIAQAKEPRSHQKTKHIVRRYHIIREIVACGDVEICNIGIDENIADPLTKDLGKPKHESHTWSMGIQKCLIGLRASGRLLYLGALAAIKYLCNCTLYHE
ncbi:unnamed protein product [Cuscuta campestris]|uniref:Reverse transcriptase Ty1/copia-type domain-containing protein n=1 Tax=Cuscuta campestris TaxID=132261 RepID=A0A484LD16_9ASTE|nr:unnamed protein product [Cuscuta campestris]